jgi:hypothetical protein
MYDSDGNFNLSTPITIGSGTASAVAVSPVNDRDTGMYFPGENKVALVAAGSSIFEVADKVRWTANEARGPNLSFTTNQINEWLTNASAEIAVNYNGYNNGTTQFRDLAIYDGKNGLVAKFKGADKSLTLEGPLISTTSGPLAGFRNAIINGNFDIWQRGTSFTGFADGTYMADRWYVGFNGTGATRTVSRQSFALGQTDVPNEPAYFLRFNQSVAGSGGTYNNVVQRIESVRTFAGKTISISFYAKAASSITLPSIASQQYFGSGGSPSANVATTIASNVSVGTSWAKYTYQVTLPSISGKTLGSDNNDYLTFEIGAPLNTTFTLDIAQVQIEIGSVATEFERRPIGTELELCQRYYWKTFPLATTPAQNAGVTGAFVFGAGAPSINSAYSGASFPVAMRVAPTVTGFNPSASNSQARNGTTGTDFSSTVVYSTEWGFYLTATAGSSLDGWSSGQISRLHLTATAEL